MALLRIQARTVIKKWNLNTKFVQILEPLGSNFGEKLAFNAQQFQTHGAQRKRNELKQLYPLCLRRRGV